MQGQKNTRRKRKDHQSRDFTCRCGKSYLSYAAAYTHVKKKHNLEKQYLNDIGKPQRQQLPRGRPKQKSEVHSSIQIQQLSIIQEAILKIYHILQGSFDKIILEGNSKQRVGQIEKVYTQLIQQNKQISQVKMDEQTEKFIRDINKHFSAQISARIKLAITVISKLINYQEVQSEELERKIDAQLNSYDIWRGKNQINNIIYQAFIKWAKLQP